jgi:hypothetical protein
MILPMIAKAVCPVCNKPSYSRGGLHPQCAVARADAKLRAVLKSEALAAEKTDRKKPWSKVCPKCRRQIPARRIVCDCGQKFAAQHSG